MEEVLTGKIEQVRFFSEETGFIVMNVQTDQLERSVLMTGYLPSFSEQMNYRFYGEFTVHPKYGKQFKINRYEQLQLDDRVATINYLSSDLFNGIGPAMATQIVDTLGPDAIDKITNNPDCLDYVRGMTTQKKEVIAGVIQEKSEQQKTLQFLMGCKLSLKMATRILQEYGEMTIEVVKHNPYQLIDIEGIGFKSADELAMELQFPKNHPYRLKAALLQTLKQLCMNEGSTYINAAILKQVFMRSYNLTDDYDSLLNELLDEENIILENDNVYPQTLYDAEKNIAKCLKRYIQSEGNLDYDFEDVEDNLMELEEKWNIEYEDSQREAIFSFLENDIMILSGGPGTGKTTIVKAMIELYKKMMPANRIALVAPTGRASKRLSEACGLEATTIHRLLKWDVFNNVFNMNQDNPIEYDLLIIDEFSMVDTFLFSNLLSACSNVSKILMIGDEAQLPSIAPGQVLLDLISTGQIETIFLKHIFRQHAKSQIVSISHQIRNNEFDNFNGLTKESDIHFLNCKEPDVIRFVSKIVSKALNEGYDLYDFQILSPMYQGLAGIDALNEALQKLVNPPSDSKNQVKIFGHIFREGDKVLQLKNRPDDNVFNGDIGLIIEIQKKDNVYYLQDKIIVDFEGDIVEYTSQEFNQLTLAYCMSIHKAQGSEFKIVVMPFCTRHERMLKKNLIYTAMTRAKQALFLIGEQDIFLKGITQNESSRNTTLKECFEMKQASFSPYDFLD